MKKNLHFLLSLPVLIFLCSLQQTNAQSWLLTGNAATNFFKLGTTNLTPLRFYTNNVERMRIDALGKIGIGTTAPNASALLDISSTTKGILIPRMSQAHRNAIPFPVTGLLIFQTDGIKGLYYYDATWKAVASSAFANTALSNLGTTNVNVDLSPGATNAMNLGSSPLGWKSLYLTGEVYMNSTRFLSAPGNFNTFTGIEAGKLLDLSSGGANSAFGAYSLYNNIEGNTNSAFGFLSLYNNLGHSNTAMGAWSLSGNIGGDDNTAVGKYTLQFNGDGNENTALGFSAGDFTSNPSRSTFLGTYATGIPDLYNATVVGSRAYATASNQVRIGDDDVTSIGGIVDWTNFSDGRFKKNMNENVPGLTFINELRPITYTLDIDGLQKAKAADFERDRKPAPIFGPGKGPALSSSNILATPPKPASQQEVAARQAKAKIVYTGFVAQEVEVAARKLNYDFSGVDAPRNDKDFYGLRYSEFVVPLVKAVQELDSENKKLKEELAALKQAVMELKKDNLNNNNPSTHISSAYLEQNAPNPFGHTTVIRYYVPLNSNSAAIVITNAKGQLIKRISLGSMGSGQETVNCGAWAAGSYYYTLWVNEQQVDTKQMMITRR